MISINLQCRVLLIAGLISVGFLTGCESNFESFYKPEATGAGAPAPVPQPRITLPELVYSDDPNRDGRPPTANEQRPVA